jgi:Polysaccharide deacetylase
MMLRWRWFLVALLCGGGVVVSTFAEEPKSGSVLYRDTVYVSITVLAEALGGKSGFAEPKEPLGLQPLQVAVGEKAWQFPDGGDRVLGLPAKKESFLKHPVLVIGNDHFVPLEECSEVFGYRVEKGDVLRLVGNDQRVELRPAKVAPPDYRHEVGPVEALSEAVVLTMPLPARRSLHEGVKATELPKGTTLLVRRKAEVDGTTSLVVTDCGPSLESYLVAEKELRARSAAAETGGTTWADVKTSFQKLAVEGIGLRRGDADKLGKSVCVTVDMCWSLRPHEAGLFAALKEAGERGTGKAYPVLFVSGRWIEQHPVAMQELIDLGQGRSVEVVWGLHSWSHPKSGAFMNDYSRPQFREDTLRLEKLMLAWGVVPTVYYRFPGLIHDRTRLEASLDLDLLPIDCDSWMYLVEARSKSPYAQPVREGGIILVHGNGNEPGGIQPLERWLGAHRDWELGPVSRFVVPTR